MGANGQDLEDINFKSQDGKLKSLNYCKQILFT